MRKIILIIWVILVGAYSAQADTVWLSGHHEINNGDVYGEIWMYNDATLDILGGDIYRVAAYNTTVTNWYDGQMESLWANDNSIVNIYGGSLGGLASRGNSIVNFYGGSLERFVAYQNGILNLYAYDVIHHSTGGTLDRGWIEGYYIENDAYFSFDFASTDAFSHIIVIEPISAAIDIQPDTLNISSKGKWLTCHIYLPEDYNVTDVNSYSILLEDQISADWLWFNEKQNVVMARFSRSELAAILEPGEVTLTVSGRFIDGTYFEGTDVIRVIDKGRKEK